MGVKVAAAPRLAVSREDLRIARAVVAGPTLGSAVNLLVEMGTRHKIISEYAKWTARAAVNAGSPIKGGRTVRALLKEVAFSDVLDSLEPISRDEFNEWHKRETEKLRCLARPHLPPNWREAHGPEFPAGWAAKLINVYLKTAAYVGNLGRPGLRCVLHPPVDNRLKDGLLELFTTCRKIHDAVSFPSITSIAEYKDYQKIIEGCKAAADCLKCDLIEVDRFPLIG